MAQAFQIAQSARIYCGRPADDLLDEGTILTVLFGRIDYYRTLLGLTDEDWLVGQFFLMVNNQQNEYIVPVANFNRPIKVEFYNPSYPWRNGPPIDMVHIQDSHLVSNSNNEFYYAAGMQDQLGSEGSYIASAFSFYGVNPTTVRVIPRPIQSVQYRIFYEPTKVDDPRLADVPQIQPQFHDMLAVSTACLCMGIYYKGDDIQIKLGALTEERNRLEKQFNNFRMMQKHANVKHRRGFRPGGRAGMSGQGFN